MSFEQDNKNLIELFNKFRQSEIDLWKGIYSMKIKYEKYGDFNDFFEYCYHTFEFSKDQIKKIIWFGEVDSIIRKHFANQNMPFIHCKSQTEAIYQDSKDYIPEIWKKACNRTFELKGYYSPDANILRDVSNEMRTEIKNKSQQIIITSNVKPVTKRVAPTTKPVIMTKRRTQNTMTEIAIDAIVSMKSNDDKKLYNEIENDINKIIKKCERNDKFRKHVKILKLFLDDVKKEI